MSKTNICFASCLLLALAGCKAADSAANAGATPQAPSSEAASNAEPASTPAAAGKDFEGDAVGLVQGTAKMQAAVVACNLASRTQTDQAIAGQRARYVSQGYDGAAFDRLHGAAFEETLEKMNAADAGQKAQSCEQIKAFGEKMSQMGKDMQEQMQDPN